MQKAVKVMKQGEFLGGHRAAQSPPNVEALASKEQAPRP